ncbi:Endocytosis regulator [Fusarium poae]|jgi:hypothetical protein|uniref:hypothetical protein n=1 Tax=Fusarium poae TaxID=36050 RepID=UPI001CEB8D31|nr:hypothetical protein FPOAC1_005459 [Fusarium poae]KAG8672197.1 hypothetical protein FPOAC1_005459 [Fusarium poae]
MTGLLQLIRPRAICTSLLRKPIQGKRNKSPVSLDCHIGTSPIIIRHDSNNDEDSVISGSLMLQVTEDSVEVQTLYAILRVHTINRKPFKKGCKGCKHQFTELKRCELITTTITLNEGSYMHNLSYRIPSYLPPSMDTSIVSVTYELEAVASVRRTRQLSTNSHTITLHRVLPVVRSIPILNTQTYSNRIYQAAGIEVECVFNTVMNPKTKNRATLTMSGLRSSPDNGQEVHFWRVCSGSWILEETIKSTASACSVHCCQDKTDSTKERKKRTILGDSTFYNGWKTDDNAGTLSIDFDFSIRQSLSHYTQDTGDVGDTSVTHALVLEMQMIKEIYPKGRPDLVTRTGVGRILRSERRVVLSDYTTLSNQPVKESLPRYQDVCTGPPVYEEL